MTAADTTLVVGTGSAGRAVASALRSAGRPVLGFVGRTEAAADEAAAACGGAGLGASRAPSPRQAEACVVLLAVRDDDVAPVAADLVGWGGWSGRTVLHLSGALDASALAPLASAGAATGSFHPLMTFPREPDGRPAAWPPDTPVGIEGDEGALAAARGLAATLGSRVVVLRSADKAAWHAAATIAGNLSTVLVGLGARVLERVDVQEGEAILAPLARESIVHAGRRGARAALTGPVARGDAGTLERHVEVLERLLGGEGGAAVRQVHALLSLLALDLVEERLAAGDAHRLRRVLEAAERRAATARRDGDDDEERADRRS